jgi:hypothetical protein
MLGGGYAGIADFHAKFSYNYSIPSPISMGDLGFGRHPARLAVAWHPADSTMAKA